MNNKVKLKVSNPRCEYMENPIGLGTLKPRLSWIIESGDLNSNVRNIMQSAYCIQVSKDDSSFTFTHLVWDTGIVHSDQSLHVEYSGQSLESRTRYYYRVKVWDQNGNESEWCETSHWEMGLLKEDEWIAKWISADIEANVNGQDSNSQGGNSYESNDQRNNNQDSSNSESSPKDNFSRDNELDPCPYLRKTFKLDGKIKKARVYASALGLYELQINGERAGEYLFTPGWTSYNKRIQYQAYDVTSSLNDGQNAIGVILGNGWYKGNLAWVKKRNVYGDELAAFVQMHITYEDGKEEVVFTDESWKSSTGSILMSEIYHGETYDARLEKNGWDLADYCDKGWDGVIPLDKEKQVLIAHEGAYVKKIEEINPISIIKTPSGETVIDIGQNMVGWVRFNVKGKAGDKVVLQHAEVLDKNGNFYIENLRSAKQRIEYILKGSEIETYEPHFTFQGFRYVKLVEYPGNPSLDDFRGIVIHSDLEPTGNFECSNELVNQLWHNILWGQKGNFLDVPTDCPQRDERLGWTGDAQVFIRTACLNMNTALFFKKWLGDLKADQLENGGVPHVVPHVLRENDYSSSAWADAAVICPWTIYLCYGDKRILEEQYESMKSWVEYIRTQGDNEYLWNTGFHYGDWLALDAKEEVVLGQRLRTMLQLPFIPM